MTKAVLTQRFTVPVFFGHRVDLTFLIPPGVVFSVPNPFVQDVRGCGGYGLPVDGAYTHQNRRVE